MASADARLKALGDRAAAREAQLEAQRAALETKRQTAGLKMDQARVDLEAKQARSALQKEQLATKFEQTTLRINQLTAKQIELDMRSVEALGNRDRKVEKIAGTVKNVAEEFKKLDGRQLKLDIDKKAVDAQLRDVFKRVADAFGSASRMHMGKFIDVESLDIAEQRLRRIVVALREQYGTQEKLNAAIARAAEIEDEDKRAAAIAKIKKAVDDLVIKEQQLLVMEKQKVKAAADLSAAQEKAMEAKKRLDAVSAAGTAAEVELERKYLNILMEEVAIEARKVQLSVANNRAEQNRLSAIALAERQLRDIEAARARNADLITARQGDLAAYRKGSANIDARDVKSVTDYNTQVARLQLQIKDLVTQGDRLEAEYVAAMSAIKKQTVDTTNQVEKLKKKTQELAGGFAGGVKGGAAKAFENIFGFSFKSLTDLLKSPGAMLGGLGAGIGFMGTGLIATAITAPFKLATAAATSFFNVLKGGIGTMKQWVASAQMYNLEVLQFSIQTGVALKDAREFVSVFKVLGLNTMFTAIGIGGLTKEIAANNKFLTNMGIATRTAEGGLRGVAEVIKDLRDKYHSLNEEGRTAFMANINEILPFASTIMPMITMDPKVPETLEKMNVVLSDIEQKDMNRVSASLATLQAAGQGVANAFTVALAPAISDFANIVADLVIRNVDKIQSFFRMISGNIQDLLYMLGLFDGMSDNVGTIAEATDLAAGQGTSSMDAYAMSVTAVDKNIREMRADAELLSEALDDQRAVVDDLRDAMQDQLEVISDQKEEVQDALEAQLRPLEDSIDLLDERKQKWQEEKEAASNTIQAEIAMLETQNALIERNLRDATRPLRKRLDDLKRGKETLTDEGDGSFFDEQKDAIKKQIDSIKRASDAQERSIQGTIKGLGRQKDALQDQIKVIQRAQREYERGLDAQKRLLEEQIRAIEEVSDAATDAAKEQEYWDRRAYLMGQTLLAQAEARARALSDRQSRSRQNGESDIEYQLRMMMLNESNNIDNLKRQEELADLDAQRNLDILNRARKEQIDLLKDEIDELGRLKEVREAADEEAIQAIQARIDALDAQSDAAQNALAAVRDAADAQVQALNDQLDALEAQEQAAEDAAKARIAAIDSEIAALEDQVAAAEEAARAQIEANNDVLESWKRLKQAKEDYFDFFAGNPDAENLANQKIAKETELLDVNKQIAAGGLGGASLDALRERANQLSNEIASLDMQLISYRGSGPIGGISLVDKQIDDIKRVMEKEKEAADARLETLEDQAEAIRDVYEPQIKAIEDVIESHQREEREIQRAIRALEREKAATEELRDAEIKRMRETGDELGDLEGSLRSANSAGARLGSTLRRIFLSPFMTERENVLEEQGLAYSIANQENPDAAPWRQSSLFNEIMSDPGLSDKRPSIAKAIGDMLEQAWDEIEPYVVKFGELMGRAILKGVGTTLGIGFKALMAKFDPTDKNSWWYRYPGSKEFDSWLDVITDRDYKDLAGKLITIGKFGQNAAGDFVTQPTVSQLAEGGFPEAVISTDPKYANRSRAILRQFFATASKTGAANRILDVDPSISGSIRGRGMLRSGSFSLPDTTSMTSVGGDTFNVQFGDINANTAADAAAIKAEVVDGLRQFIEGLPARSKAMALPKVR